MVEKTLVILKPDAVKRGLVGQIISRFENVGLKLVAARMVRADEETLQKHYPTDRAYIENMGKKTLETMKEYQYDAKKVLGTDDPFEIGTNIRNDLINYMMMGPVVMMVWEGAGAVSLVRKMVGYTSPYSADIGTIRGDFSHDSPLNAPLKNRGLRNMIHASGSKEEADAEISLWFSGSNAPSEYERVDQIFF